MFHTTDENDWANIANIKVIGVGGSGGNIINNMVAAKVKELGLVAVNTDIQVLDTSMAPKKIQIGKNVTQGLGAGSKPEIGRDAAIEDESRLEEVIKGSDMVIVTTGMGGGTGSGAAPVIAKMAKNMGILTVAIVTKPFSFEGGRRISNSNYGIKELEAVVDSIMIIPNDRISMEVEKNSSLLESFALANNVITQAILGITSLILVPGLINLDFADLKTVIKDAGRAAIGMGVGKGDGAAHEAAKKAMQSSLWGSVQIGVCDAILINITGGLELSLDDVQESTALVFESANEDANIIVGAVIDPDIKDEIRVTVIATRFKDSDKMGELPDVEMWTGSRSPGSYKGADKVLAKSLARLNNEISMAQAEETTRGMTFYFSAAEYDEEKIAKIISIFSDMYRSVGGDGLIIDDVNQLEYKSNNLPVNV